MRAVLQRVSEARVIVGGQVVSEIQRGLVILIAAGHGDGEGQARYLAEKTAHLRIFEDEGGKSNLSVLDAGGQALVVSQFTLYADTRKGRRPSFNEAARPETAAPLIDRFVEVLVGLGVPTRSGVFGATMQLSLVNDGPMTILLER